MFVVLRRFLLVLFENPIAASSSKSAVSFSSAPTTKRFRHHDAVIRVYDAAGNVIETHEHKGEFKEWWILLASHDTSRYTDFHDSAFTG
jgi:hypothetical protein